MKLTPYSRPLSDVKHVRKFHFSFFFSPGGGILQRKMNFHLIRCPLGYTKNFFGCFKFSFLTHGRKLGRGRETDVYIHTHISGPWNQKTNLPGQDLVQNPTPTGLLAKPSMRERNPGLFQTSSRESLSLGGQAIIDIAEFATEDDDNKTDYNLV